LIFILVSEFVLKPAAIASEFLSKNLAVEKQMSRTST
jgi:hypothetical protein